jgi:hypothetical protein
MVNQNQKDNILRFVLEASQEENQRLGLFMAGIRAQGQGVGQGKTGEGETAGVRDYALVPDTISDAGE